MIILESPRDGLQGIKKFISTDKKIKYLNLLLNVGFDIVDVGSFVSPKFIPQMKDTFKVIDNLNVEKSKSELLTIVANERGANDASKFDKIKYFGYPFSISDTFLKKNTNSDIENSYDKAIDIFNVANKNNKELLVYISMGFGNPYGDYWDVEILDKYVNFFNCDGIKKITISDTIGISTPKQIHVVFDYLINKYKDVDFGFHLHTKKGEEQERMYAAIYAGCNRMDTVIGGLGGCPAALSNGDLISNLETKTFVDFCNKENILINVNIEKINKLEKILKTEIL